MSRYIHPSGLRIRKIFHLKSRRGLLRAVLPLLCLALFTACGKEEIGPVPVQAAQYVSPTSASASRLSVPADAPAQQAYVTVKNSACILSLWPQKLLRINGTDGQYLIPFESDGFSAPAFEDHYLVTYQVIPHDDRFYEPGIIYCQAVPADYDGGNAVRILAMQRVAAQAGLD